MHDIKEKLDEIKKLLKWSNLNVSFYDNEIDCMLDDILKVIESTHFNCGEDFTNPHETTIELCQNIIYQILENNNEKISDYKNFSEFYESISQVDWPCFNLTYNDYCKLKKAFKHAYNEILEVEHQAQSENTPYTSILLNQMADNYKNDNSKEYFEDFQELIKITLSDKQNMKLILETLVREL